MRRSQKYRRDRRVERQKRDRSFLLRDESEHFRAAPPRPASTLCTHFALPAQRCPSGVEPVCRAIRISALRPAQEKVPALCPWVFQGGSRELRLPLDRSDI